MLISHRFGLFLFFLLFSFLSLLQSHIHPFISSATTKTIQICINVPSSLQAQGIHYLTRHGVCHGRWKEYCLKYQETRAGSMLFLSNTYFMMGLTLSLMSVNHLLYYFGRILLLIQICCLRALRCCGRHVEFFMNLSKTQYLHWGLMQCTWENWFSVRK